MSIKEKLQQIQADRARQAAEEWRRWEEVRELERDRQRAEEARKNAEMQRVKGILDSKGIPQMLERDALPLLREMCAEATLGDVREEDIIVQQGKRSKDIKTIGVVIYGSEVHGISRNYDHARLGVFIEPGVGTVHLCTYGSNFSRAQFSLNDRNLKDKMESALAKILSEPGAFSWNDPDHSFDFDISGR